MPDKPKTLSSLLDTLPQVGEVRWIGVRSAKYEPLISLEVANAVEGRGLDGDHYASRGGKRQVTLIQMEHLAAMASMLHLDGIEAGLLRRNIAVTGINLLALKGREFQIGLAVMKYTGPCHPCSRMETALGVGGYNAVRGHGGITAQVLASGTIRTGDKVSVLG